MYVAMRIEKIFKLCSLSTKGLWLCCVVCGLGDICGGRGDGDYHHHHYYISYLVTSHKFSTKYSMVSLCIRMRTGA
jgi:hypothetical protein